MRLHSALTPKTDVAFVTAFYPGPSKHSRNRYLKWAERLFLATPHAPLHFYVPSREAANELAARGAPNSVVFHVLNFWSLPANQLDINWNEQVAQDPERIIHRSSPHLYVVWNSKVGLVAQVAQNSEPETMLTWIDAGYVRNMRTQIAVRFFPTLRQNFFASTGRLHFLALSDFTEAERRKSIFASPNDFRGLIRLGGGMFAGRPGAWMKFSRAYSDALVTWSSEGEFVGKDQNVFASLLLRRPNLGVAWKARRLSGNPWFSFPQSFGRRSLPQ